MIHGVFILLDGRYRRRSQITFLRSTPDLTRREIQLLGHQQRTFKVPNESCPRRRRYDPCSCLTNHSSQIKSNVEKNKRSSLTYTPPDSIRVSYTFLMVSLISSVLLGHFKSFPPYIKVTLSIHPLDSQFSGVTETREDHVRYLEIGVVILIQRLREKKIKRFKFDVKLHYSEYYC